MNALGWMHRKFRQNNDDQSRNVSTRKSYSCFSSLSELNEQQYYPEPKNNSTPFRHPRVCSESSIALKAHKAEKVNEEKTVDMSPKFFHGFLAIGTLGFESITTEPMGPTFETEEETRAAKNELLSLNKKLKKQVEKEVHDVSNESCEKSFHDSLITSCNKEIKGIDTKDNNGMVVYPLTIYSEMSATKKEETEQNSTPDDFFKKNDTSYKRSGKLDKGKKKGTRVLHFMKKMMKKIDFTSGCNLISASGNDSTEKKLTKVLQMSRKIHPETAAGLHVTKSHNYKVKNVFYDEGCCEKDVRPEDEDMGPHAEMLNKEIDSDRIFPNRPLNNQPAERKAYWIKTDADYLVLEF